MVFSLDSKYLNLIWEYCPQSHLRLPVTDAVLWAKNPKHNHYSQPPSPALSPL